MKKNVVSFMNMKGGVGKTTLCVNIAGTLAKEHDKRVLIIDMDPQLNASQYLLDNKTLSKIFTEKRTIYSLYNELIDEDLNDMVIGEVENKSSKNTNIIHNVMNNLDIICGDLNLTKLTNGNPDDANILNDFIEENNLTEEYSFIFIDCPPTQSIYTSSALIASNYYILPIKPDFLSTIGVKLFKKMIERYNKRKTIGPKVSCLGMIINLYTPSNPYHQQKIKEIEEEYKFDYIFDNKIYNAPCIGEGSEEHKLIQDIQARTPDIKKVVNEFIERYNEKAGGKKC